MQNIGRWRAWCAPYFESSRQRAVGSINRLHEGATRIMTETLPAIIKVDVGSKLERARAALAAATARIAELDGLRGTALAEDNVDEVLRLDRLLDQERRAATLHTDRVAALEVEERRQDWQRAERARADAIHRVLEPFAAECADMAAELAQTLGTACDLFERIEAKRLGLLASWPAAVPKPEFSYGGLHFPFLERELFQSHPAYDGARFIFEVKRRLPMIADSVRGSVARYIKSCADRSIVPAEFLPPEPETPADDEEEAA
jgi:hypothetical protein